MENNSIHSWLEECTNDCKQAFGESSTEAFVLDAFAGTLALKANQLSKNGKLSTVIKLKALVRSYTDRLGITAKRTFVQLDTKALELSSARKMRIVF